MKSQVISQICLFEDDRCHKLLPLVYLRPVYDLRCGVLTLREKVMRSFPTSSLVLHCRGYMQEMLRQKEPGVRVNDPSVEPTLFINGRVIVNRPLLGQISVPYSGDVVYVREEEVVAAHVGPRFVEHLRQRMGRPLSRSDFEGLPEVQLEADVIDYPWNLVHHNGREIVRDIDGLRGKQKGRTPASTRVWKGVHLLSRKDVILAPDVVLKPGVVIDAEEGPVYIGPGVKVLPHSMIMGPAAIGAGSSVKAGAIIYENTTIGPVCKVGGEIEESVIQGYSNKQHAGFLGHAYVGSWVNLGADTNNSDLKNNYGSVTVELGDEEVDTGLQFVGLTMGDHSKSAINTMFNTGTVVGVSSNVFGAGFPPKYVPSFSWGAAGETFTTYGIDKAIEVARRVMARRHVDLSTAEEEVIRAVFDMTAHDRIARGLKS